MNPEYFQSNPRIGKGSGYTGAPTTGGTAGSWYLQDTYDLPVAVYNPAITTTSASTPATTPTLPGSKYCVIKYDYGLLNALRAGETNPHFCSSGNVAAGASATEGLGAALPTSITQGNWYVDSTSGTPVTAATSIPTSIPAYSAVSPTVLANDLKAWGIPCYPTLSGYCSIHEGTATAPNTGQSSEAPLVGGGEPFTPKKYQYWAIKLKPYLETQFSLQNKIYADQMF
jgi:hypothetical protein